jgi:hypothetical protein
MPANTWRNIKWMIAGEMLAVVAVMKKRKFLRGREFKPLS